MVEKQFVRSLTAIGEHPLKIDTPIKLVGDSLDLGPLEVLAGSQHAGQQPGRIDGGDL